MKLLAIIAVLLVWVAAIVVLYVIDPMHIKTGPESENSPANQRKDRTYWPRIAAQLVLLVWLVNSVTFTIGRGMSAMAYSSGEPKIVTLYDAGTYQTDEVHYLIAGMNVSPEDMAAILPDDLNGTIKAVKYQQLAYDAGAIEKELSDDIRRYGYQEVTVWAMGTAAMATDFTATYLRDDARTILIDPCPNALVLQPELQQKAHNLAMWQRAGAYLLGWLSLIPDANGHSINLKSMQLYGLDYETELSKPYTGDVVGLVLSEQHDSLQPDALKGLYSEAIQTVVPGTANGNIVEQHEQYKAAVVEVWEKYLATLEPEEELDPDYDPYADLFSYS